MVEEFLRSTSKEKVYQRTGIQFQQFNSLIQLFALRRRQYPALEWATGLLFMPDALTYLVTGVAKSEFSIATTSQLFNPTMDDWDTDQLSTVGLKRSLMHEVVRPGTRVGSLTQEVAAEIGAPTLPVIAVATHDTGSAVAAVPAEGTDWAYISSGTWSLMGIETSAPVLTLEAMRANFTNEGGVDGTFRFLRNIMGLWLLQECRRQWSTEHEFSYDELMSLASLAPPFRSLVDPDWHGFYRPADMPEAIKQFCFSSGQPLPGSAAQFTRCILESLALKYRSTLEALRGATRTAIGTIHIIGGGSKNRLLCQFTANATGLPVLAGPAEATAIGNIMVQARTNGFAESFADMRSIVRRSWRPEPYRPEDVTLWDRAYDRFVTLNAPH
jgi:rhamnulokinase